MHSTSTPQTHIPLLTRFLCAENPLRAALSRRRSCGKLVVCCPTAYQAGSRRLTWRVAVAHGTWLQLPRATWQTATENHSIWRVKRQNNTIEGTAAMTQRAHVVGGFTGYPTQQSLAHLIHHNTQKLHFKNVPRSRGGLPCLNQQIK